MRRWIRPSLLLIACIGITSPGSIPAQARTQQDGALHRRVSVEWKHAELSASLRDLSRQTGLRIRCDPWLARRRVLLLARDQTVDEVLSRLAGFLGASPGKCVWVVDPEDERGRYLREDAASRRVRREHDLARQKDFRRRLSEALALGRLSDEAVMELREKDPLVAYRIEQDRGLFRIPAALTAETLQRVAAGAPSVSLSFEELNPEAQAAVMSELVKLRFSKGYQPPCGGPPQTYFRYDAQVHYPLSRLELRRYRRADKPGLQVWLQHSAHGGKAVDILSTRGPQPDGYPSWMSAYQREEKRRAAAARKQPPAPEPVWEGALAVRVTIRHRVTKAGPDKPGTEYVCLPEDALAQIAPQTKLQVLADYDPGFLDYYKRYWRVSLAGDLVDIPLGAALNKLAELWGWEWELRGGWLAVKTQHIRDAASDGLDLSPGRPFSAPQSSNAAGAGVKAGVSDPAGSTRVSLAGSWPLLRIATK